MKIIDWPNGIEYGSITWTQGPNVKVPSESVSSRFQTVESPTGLVGFDLTLQPMNERTARIYRGLISFLHGGANAVRIRLYDPDRPTFDELGYDQNEALGTFYADTWSDGQTWAEGNYWESGLPLTTLTASATKGTTAVTINLSPWGGELLSGTLIGFPLHFGLYTVKYVKGSVATIWPPLRAAVASGDYVTLEPVIACRLSSVDGGRFSRGGSHIVDATISLVEVPDEIVNTYATEAV